MFTYIDYVYQTVYISNLATPLPVVIPGPPVTIHLSKLKSSLRQIYCRPIQSFFLNKMARTETESLFDPRDVSRQHNDFRTRAKVLHCFT